MTAELGRGESPQVRTGVVVAIVAGILVVLLVIGFGLQPLFPERIGQTYTVQHGFPAPGVVSDERAERRALEARQRRDLAGANGRMPIGDAMKAIAAKGDQAFDLVSTAP